MRPAVITSWVFKYSNQEGPSTWNSKAPSGSLRRNLKQVAVVKKSCHLTCTHCMDSEFKLLECNASIVLVTFGPLQVWTKIGLHVIMGYLNPQSR